MGQDSWMEYWERDLPGMEGLQKKYVVNRLEVATTRSERQVLRRRLKELDKPFAERHRELVATQAWCPDCGGALGSGSHPTASWDLSRMRSRHPGYHGVGPDDLYNRDGRRPRLINPVTGEHRWCNCRAELARRLRAREGAGGKQEPVSRTRSGGPAKARRSRPVSVANELKKLAALRDDNVISEQEFQTLKQQLIEGD